MSTEPYPHFGTEEQEITWLNDAGSEVSKHMREPTEDEQREFRQFLLERPDEESSRKPVTVRMKLRDLARLKGLARKLDTKYQTLMMELIAEGLDRREAALKADRPSPETLVEARGAKEDNTVIEMAEHLNATRALIDLLLEGQGSKLSELIGHSSGAPARLRRRAKKA